MIILGVDPGTTRIGYGAIKKERGELRYIVSGLLKITRTEKTGHLIQVEKTFTALIQKLRPDAVAIEKLFFGKNVRNAFDVAEARGVLTLAATRHKIRVVEYSPTEVKLGVTGYGRADKKSVAAMVAKILKINTIKKLDDETDAIAVAITAASDVRLRAPAPRTNLKKLKGR